ncbi:MAG: prephenate dehydrogenase/arogenate dehydrogenase family protein [Actinomycetia bacterium]|nr:prephenate dehydrogenase/arogenate dehydrogenase family protein [Actinomycetes bacterium]
MATADTRQVEIVGLGLMGLSLALALVAAGYVVYGRDRDPAAERFAGERGVHVGAAPAPACLVVAVPPDAVAEVVAARGATLPDGCVVTDLASVKGPVLPALAALEARLRPVSCHPMAGTEQQGPRAARADLYQGQPWAVVPVPGRPVPWDVLTPLVAAAGGRPVTVPAALHDRLVAYTSHLPYVLALALMGTLEQAPKGWRDLVGPGLVSATRTAGSPPGLWRQILGANRGAVLEALGAFRREVEAWEQILREDPDSLEARITTLQERRRTWPTRSS